MHNEKTDPQLAPFAKEFIQDRREEISALKSKESINFEFLSNLVHRWKGFAEPYGFGKLIVFGDKLLLEARNSDNDNKILNILDEIESYLEFKEEELDTCK